MEVSRREKQAGIIPDPDIDAYMKVPYCIHKTFSSMSSYLLTMLSQV